MNSPTNKSPQSPGFAICAGWILPTLLLSLMAGCAQKPWGEPLAEEPAGQILRLARQMQQRDTGCAVCIDTDIKVAAKNHLSEHQFNGYLQLKQPKLLKYISSNPFGQPVLLLTSNGTTFQWINTLDRVYKTGSLASYGLYHDIPIFFLQADWGSWLTGRITNTVDDIEVVRQDEENRGVWLSTPLTPGPDPYRQHLLIDPENKLLLSRLLTDEHGTTLLRITYSEWQDLAGCPQPAVILLNEMSFGGELVLNFSDTQVMTRCPQEDFKLPVPPGYNRQFQP